jgi:hypothetical protein
MAELDDQVDRPHINEYNVDQEDRGINTSDPAENTSSLIDHLLLF